MARAEVAPSLAMPWSARLFDALPVSPAWAGAGISTLVLAAYFGVGAATGSLAASLFPVDSHMTMHYRITTVNALLLGFLPAAQVYLARWTRRHLDELSSLLPPDAGAGALEDAHRRRAGVFAGVIGCVTLPLMFMVLPTGSVLLESSYWTLTHAWDWFFVPVIGWLTGRFIHAVVVDAIGVSRLAVAIGSIDVFDQAPYAPFVRQGLLSALLAVIFLVIVLPLVGVKLISAESTAIAMVALIVTATAALLLPVGGIRDRIRQEKSVRLLAVRSAIRASDLAIREGRAAQDDVARLPGLLALETRIEGVREWPFDTGSLLRFGLYVALGLGSWLGGAAVERLLDYALR